MKRAVSVCLVTSALLAVAATGCTSKAQGGNEAQQSTKSSAAEDKVPTKVEGHNYQSNGGVVVIEFRKNGRCYVSTGPVSNPCTYSQSDNKVTMLVEKDKTVFTVDDEDGALLGPNAGDGMLSRLTLKK